MGNWWVKWQAGGRGNSQVLSEAEQAAVRQAVLDHTPIHPGAVQSAALFHNRW
ncbi:hypothetical protein GCM10009647_002550 [Streptomyces sanglieri]